jgi:hypothetical protein
LFGKVIVAPVPEPTKSTSALEAAAMLTVMSARASDWKQNPIAAAYTNACKHFLLAARRNMLIRVPSLQRLNASNLYMSPLTRHRVSLTPRILFVVVMFTPFTRTPLDGEYASRGRSARHFPKKFAMPPKCCKNPTRVERPNNSDDQRIQGGGDTEAAVFAVPSIRQ